ncbi:DUF397 domain-containing protein [Streptomyces sp. NPDC048442]|uniref:DUF397 domain-containing protein n=1 Tax=Streptomyces sp. NPDC048442 TaxID=3154823 RepID=UPI003427F210
MKGKALSEQNWQRSSFCAGGGNNCVEVAAYERAGIALRESEDPGAVLSTRRTALSALVRSVKAGPAAQPRP